MTVSKMFIVAAIAYLSACQNNQSIISVSYQNGGNLQKGNKVLLDGISVGKVSGFHFVPEMVFVDLCMEEGIKIPLNSKFVINKSLLGSATIIIKPSNENGFITNTDTVVGVSFKEPGVDFVKQRKMEAGIRKIAQGLSEVFQATGTDSARSIR